MTDYDKMLSRLSALGYQEGFVDLLGIVRGDPREFNLTAQPGALRMQDILAVNEFSLNFQQEIAAEGRLAGEGPDPSAFLVHGAKIRATASMPLLAPATGWVDPAFATLYDLFRFAYLGTATGAAAGLSIAAQAGDTDLVIDNIAEFVALPPPYDILLGDGTDGAEYVRVTGATKATRMLHLAAGCVNAHDLPCEMFALMCSGRSATFREPDFSLMSYREGMFAPCLVNKITLDATVGQPVKVSIEFAALGLLRDRQVPFADAITTLTAQFPQQPPARIVDSMSVKLSPASAQSEAFGMASAIGEPIFGGFQSLNIPAMTVTGFSLTLDNRLQEVYTLHSLQRGGKRLRENQHPYALASDGRSVEGEIKLQSAISPWACAERMAGPSALAGGGLLVDYGVFQISLPELAWAPASSNGAVGGKQARTLRWSLLADQRNALPELGFSKQN